MKPDPHGLTLAPEFANSVPAQVVRPIGRGLSPTFGFFHPPRSDTAISERIGADAAPNEVANGTDAKACSGHRLFR